MDSTLSRKAVKTVSMAGAVLAVFLFLQFYSRNWFSDPAGLQRIIQSAGPAGPALFIVLQAFQVIVPILPGGISGALGILCFGTVKGFLYSYVGVIAGSCLAFWLVRQYGWKIIDALVSKKTVDRYLKPLTESRNVAWAFAFLIAIPIAPDDLLCMLAGLTDIPFKKFFWIIVLGKPVSMFLYSYGLVWLLSLL